MPYPEAVYELKEGEEVVLLANITVNLFNKQSFGEPDPEENPPRSPFVFPTYNLNLVPEKQADQVGGYQLTLGRIIINQNETTLVSDYIPPCTSVSSHQRLIDLHTQIDQFFGQLELYAVQISQKINRKNQTNDLAMMMLNVSDKVITHLGQNINDLRWHSLYESPSHMFDKVISLGRILRNYIDSKSGAGKEDLLNYFAEWCGLSQGDFDVLFADLVNVGYNHAQIDKTAVKVQRFMKVMEELFATLNRLDYIGKRRDTGIFVAERLEGTGSGLGTSKRSTSFLAD